MFKNNDTVICPNEVKIDILKKLTKEKKIVNLKFYTLEQFKNAYFGTYNEEAIYYMMKKYNYKYDVAKIHLNNLYGNDLLIEELEKNNLLIKEQLNISNIIIIGYYKIDNYIMKEIEKYDHKFITTETKSYKPKVYECETLEEEVNFTIERIITLLNDVNINNIYIVNVGNEYENTLKAMFKFYNVPININSRKSVFGTSIVQNFLKNLKENHEFKLMDDEISNLVKEVINKYRFKELDEIIIECIENELKNLYIDYPKYKNAVNVINNFEFRSDKYYFVIGFNEGFIPNVYKDEDYLSDYKKKQLGIMTSTDKNEAEKISLQNKLKSYPNIFLSYKNKSNTTTYYPSSFIRELDLEVEKVKPNNYNSDIYNKLMLGKKIDNLIKYNIKDDELSILYSNYPNIKYLTYDNKFTGINKNLFHKYINNKLILSYSSIDNFNRCGFRYYIKNILKLELYEETFMIYIGNLFHHILSIYNNPNFNFEYEFNLFIKDRTFTSKEMFFINKLKKDLLFTIEVIKKHDSYSEFDQALYEEKIYINKDKDLKVTFMGVIDKIKYKEVNSKLLVAIIDYKTGNPFINIDNAIHGIDMQLPIYLYLVRNSELKNIQFVGFYLQKIIHNKLNFKENTDYQNELEKSYRLEGYTIDEEDKIKLFDQTYMDSKMIKGMKISSKGFYSYSKTISEEEIDNLIQLVDDKLNESIDNILDAKFDINPKKINMELVGCEYCKYKDLCFRSERDIVKLEGR